MIITVNGTSGNNSLFCDYSQTTGMHHQIWAKVFFVILYAFVLLMAFCGNLLVIYIIVMRRRLQNVTNFFICNLAVSDLFVSLTSLWLTPMYGYLGRWIWGSVMCHSVPMIQGAGIFISSLTLTAIAIDRYIVILNPFKKRMTVKVCLTVIISIWLFSLMLVAPYGLHMDLHYSPQCDFHICRELWEFGELQAAYGFTVMVLQFGIPFFVIAVCYIRIWHHLCTRKSLVHLKSDSALKRKKRLLKMLILMVSIFGLCWLPFNMLNLWRDLSPGAIDAKSYFVFLFLLSHLIAMSASGWNPVLYAWMNDNFSREYRYIFYFLCGRKHCARSNNPNMVAGHYDPDRTGNHISEFQYEKHMKNYDFHEQRNDETNQSTLKNSLLKRKVTDYES
uniref:G_PROTEIN_RECEP_F1_2 domain-containing protein n=1 Tax=Trichuris muris TaxID=70415 RepID=A0A5S6QP94_TRIMR